MSSLEFNPHDPHALREDERVRTDTTCPVCSKQIVALEGPVRAHLRLSHHLIGPELHEALKALGLWKELGRGL